MLRKSPLPKRKTPLKRSTTPLRRTARVKAVNAKRKRREFARAYGGKARVEWMKALPCAVCRPTRQRTPTECAHVGNGGMGRKADARYTIPLCASHHRDLHENGALSFEDRWLVDLELQAAHYDRLWQSHSRPRAADTHGA